MIMISIITSINIALLPLVLVRITSMRTYHYYASYSYSIICIMMGRRGARHPLAEVDASPSCAGVSV